MLEEALFNYAKANMALVNIYIKVEITMVSNIYIKVKITMVSNIYIKVVYN